MLFNVLFVLNVFSGSCYRFICWLLTISRYEFIVSFFEIHCPTCVVNVDFHPLDYVVVFYNESDVHE